MQTLGALMAKGQNHLRGNESYLKTTNTIKWQTSGSKGIGLCWTAMESWAPLPTLSLSFVFYMNSIRLPKRGPDADPRERGNGQNRGSWDPASAGYLPRVKEEQVVPTVWWAISGSGRLGSCPSNLEQWNPIPSSHHQFKANFLEMRRKSSSWSAGYPLAFSLLWAPPLLLSNHQY